MSSFSEEREKGREQIVFDVKSLMDNRRDRMRNMHKMSEAELKEQAEGARDLINQFPLIRQAAASKSTYLNINVQESWTPCGRSTGAADQT